MLGDDDEPLFYDRQLRPVGFEEYARLGQVPGYHEIGHDVVGDSEISTVWLGVNYNHSRVGPPVIFETMIFGGPYDLRTLRWRDEREARYGHRMVLAFVRRKRHGAVKHARDVARRAMKTGSLEGVELFCPHCGRMNPEHTGSPGPGDVSLCWQCRGAAVLTPRYSLRKPDEEEMAELLENPAIKQMLGAMSEAYTPDEAVALIGDEQ
jgi:hypothetical protein